MRYLTRKNYPAVIGAAFLAAGTLFAQQDGNRALLDLLVRKGVITAQEAIDLQNEVAKAQTAPAPTPAAQVSSTPAPEVPAGAVVAADKASPLSFKIGIADFTPLGFVDFTTVYRSTNVGSGIGTNFAGIPYSNSTAGQLSETRFSAQNSRLGLKIDSKVNDVKVLGYLETDFLGNAPTNLGTSSNGATLRLRNYFADLRWNGWEFLAGQDWSMMTPNRRGISPLPSDIFFTMNMDTNYQAGLVWSRQPQVRAIYHASDEMTFGLALENPDQYAGGTNGAPTVTFPTGFNTAQVDTGAATSSPNAFPDVIGKFAYDTKVDDLPWHFDVAGLYRTFKVNTFGSTVNTDSTKAGAGALFNANLQLVKGLTLVGNAYWSEGGGRYVFGQAPDFVVRPADSTGAFHISPLRTNSFLGGLEWQAAPNSMLFGYYSSVSIDRKYYQLPNGSYVGYGYPGSANSNNHRINELTLGETQTLWKNPSYGALQIISQLSFLDRQPWFVATGTPDKAKSTMLFVDVRYVLP